MAAAGDIAARTAAPTNPAPANDTRSDLLLVSQLIAPGSRVLDVGCGDGSLLHLLEETRGVDGRGIEISREKVNLSVARGLSVVQGDADRDLADYPDDAFDYVILSQTLQATVRPRQVLAEMLRIGRRAIVSFPNFGYWRVRAALGLTGRMPVNRKLPYSWYDTPNIHFCTIRDFIALCRELNVQIEQGVALDASGHRLPWHLPWWFWNLFGQEAVFLLRREDGMLAG
jgi:methionine biosynthesis protein MetW